MIHLLKYFVGRQRNASFWCRLLLGFEEKLTVPDRNCVPCEGFCAFHASTRVTIFADKAHHNVVMLEI